MSSCVALYGYLQESFDFSVNISNTIPILILFKASSDNPNSAHLSMNIAPLASRVVGLTFLLVLM